MVHVSEREEQLPKYEIGSLLQIAAEDKSVLSLGPGEPDFELPNPLVAHIKRLAQVSNHYAPPGGFRELREALARKLKRDNKIKTDPENIVVTSGSQEALLLAAGCTLDVSEEIVLPCPGYMGFLPTFQLFNAGTRFYNVVEGNAFEPDPDDIKKQITKKTKVILMNSPANPTGNVIRRRVLEEIADIAVDKNLAIFSDEAYEKILFDGAKHISVGSLNGMEDHVLTFQTFSKTYAMCGFRVGYVAAPPKLAKAILNAHVYNSICAPTLSQKLALKALSLPKKHIEHMVKEYDKRRRVIVPRLNEMGLTTPMPKGAFYAFANISSVMKDSKRFSRELLKEKVAVVPGTDFGANGYIRCSFATKLPIIEKSLDKIEKFIQKR